MGTRRTWSVLPFKTSSLRRLHPRPCYTILMTALSSVAMREKRGVTPLRSKIRSTSVSTPLEGMKKVRP